MADPNPSIWNSGDTVEITAINYGSGDAGTYEPSAAGTEYHLWNDKGNVLTSSAMTSVKITVRDEDGNEVDSITVQKWVEVKSTTIHAGADGGSISGYTDDNMADFQAIGADGYLGLGDIPYDCYRKIFIRVNIPNSAIEAIGTFKIYVTNQHPSSSIAKWFTGLFGDGVVYTGNKMEVTDNAGADSKIDIASGYALINDCEVYFGSTQAYTISTTDATYKIYVTKEGIISSTTGSIPSNSIQLASVVIASNVVDSVTDKRVYIYNMALLDRTDGNFVVADGTNWVVENGATARTSLGLGSGDSPEFAGLTLTSNLVLSANSITMTGSIGVTGSRVTKGWFTDLEITNDITINGNALTANKIEIEELGTATYDDVQDWLNNTQSSGKISGGAISSHIDAITGVTVGGAGSGELKVSDDQTAGYLAGETITVYGSSNNDGDYTVSAGGSSHAGGTTTIPVDEAVAAVADGDIRNARVDIAAGTGFIKITDSETGVTKSFDWDASYNLALTDLYTNYIHVNYNSGSPVFQATTDRSTIEYNREFTFGQVYRNGTYTWVHSDGMNLPNYVRKSHERLLALWGFRRAEGGEISEYGTRNIQSTAGIFYRGADEVTTTSKASVDDKFTSVYYDGSNWVWTQNQTAIDNTQYNNIASGLLTLSGNRYGVHWVCIDYSSNLYVVYGRGDYTLTEAQNAKIPALMPVVSDDFGIIAAKIIIKKSASSFTETISAYTEYMPSVSPSVHNELSGLSGGTAGEYYHLTSAQHAQAIIKKKLDATQAPTVNNDVDEGYTVGSYWIDVTNDKAYICLDNTDGAAVWTETTGSGAGGYTNLTSFVDQNNWKVFYSNGSGDVIELALGADGTYLKSNGAAAAPTFATPAGAGDVVKVGTPADSQVGVWTGDGTIEGAASLIYDGANLQLTGDIGSTGTRITKGWFVDLEVTNTIAGSITGNAANLSGTPALPDGTTATTQGASDNSTKLATTAYADAAGGTTTLVGLTDTPANYADKAGKILKVNSTPDAVEFVNDTNITVKTGVCTLTVAEQGTILVSAAAAYTITLPTAVGNAGLTYKFKKTDANYNLITLDANGAETFNYENSTSAPTLTYIRLNTYCAEVTVVSDGTNWQVIDEVLGQVPECSVYLSANQLNIPDSIGHIAVEFDTESYDIGSNYNVASWVSGNADGNTHSHLVDDGASQFTEAMVGKRVQNTTSLAYAYVTAFVDAGDLTLNLDIFPNGNEPYEIMYSRFVAPVAGKYSMDGLVVYANNTVVADKKYLFELYKNATTVVLAFYNHSSNVKLLGIKASTIIDLNKDDYIRMCTYQDSGVHTPDLQGVEGHTFLKIRLISKD